MSEIEKLETIESCCTQLLGELRKRTRKMEYVLNRWIYFKISMELTTCSTVQISRQIGYDHATVIHAMKKFDFDVAGNDDRYIEYLNAKILCSKSIGVSDRIIKKIDAEVRVVELEKENEKLKAESENLKNDMENCVKVSDPYEKKIFEIFRSLPERDKSNAMQKIRVIAKVSQKLNQREPVRK